MKRILFLVFATSSMFASQPAKKFLIPVGPGKVVSINGRTAFKFATGALFINGIVQSGRAIKKSQTPAKPITQEDKAKLEKFIRSLDDYKE